MTAGSKPLGQGIFAIPADQYHADPCESPSLSNSIAVELCHRSPWHAARRHPRLFGDPVSHYTAATDLGKICHALLLEGADRAAVIDATGWRTQAARTARDEARARGWIPILQKDWERVAPMLAACRSQLSRHRTKTMFTDGYPEQTLIWREPNGVWCRARLDWLHAGHEAIDDYKTARSAQPDQWSRTMFDYGYDMQAAFYLRGLRAIDSSVDPFFRFAVQETFPPYAVACFELAPDAMMLAEKKILYAIEKWGECLESGVWPGYGRRTHFVQLPAWEEERWIQKELAE